MEKNTFVCTEEEQGKRLDVYLTSVDNSKSRSFYQKMIEDGDVQVNNRKTKSKYKIKVGDEVVISERELVMLEAEAENIDISILYEDEDVVVVNKDQGMVVHPAPGNYNGTLVNALLYHCDNLSGINGVVRPGIVHRIDKDTSGILVIAKNDMSHGKLSEQFKDHSMTREYLALVEGNVKNDTGIIDKAIGRDPKTRIKMALVRDGKRAVTHYKVIQRYEGYTLVMCQLETGRTHQIRVHMASIGHPLVGDPVYGFKKQRFNLNGQMLHAKTLGFIHPRTDKYTRFESEMPECFTNVLSKLKVKEV